MPLTVALAERWPDRVPEVVAADTERSWLLLRDGGTRIADSGATRRAPASPRSVRRAPGRRDRARRRVAGHGPARPATARRRRPRTSLSSSATTGSTPDEVARLRALAPRFRELCDELAALELPASIQHDDLHQWNVFVRGDRVAIYDWGDSSVAFPLWSWLKVRRVALDYAVDPEPFRAAYLSGWTQFAERATPCARRSSSPFPPALFAYALQIRRQYDATQAHEEYETYLPMNLRRLLEQLEPA